jgi:hypothetical protein
MARCESARDPEMLAGELPGFRDFTVFHHFLTTSRYVLRASEFSSRHQQNAGGGSFLFLCCFLSVFFLVFFLVFFCWASSVSQVLTLENAGLAFVETRFRYAAYLADVSLHPDDSRKSPTWIPIAAILMALCAIGLALTLLGLF